MSKYNQSIRIAWFIMFLLISHGLPFFSFEGYSILSNTTSHLAAQGAPYAWVMDLVFIGLGVMAITVTYPSKVLYHQIIGGIFGLSLILTAFFPHAPLLANIPVNIRQDQMHSVFASMTGFSFTMLAVGHSMISRGRQRVGGIIIAIIATLISIGMMMIPEFMGLLQRLMFVSAFGWLFFYMEAPKKQPIQ